MLYGPLIYTSPNYLLTRFLEPLGLPRPLRVGSLAYNYSTIPYLFTIASLLIAYRRFLYSVISAFMLLRSGLGIYRLYLEEYPSYLTRYHLRPFCSLLLLIRLISYSSSPSISIPIIGGGSKPSQAVYGSSNKI